MSFESRELWPGLWSVPTRPPRGLYLPIAHVRAILATAADLAAWQAERGIGGSDLGGGGPDTARQARVHGRETQKPSRSYESHEERIERAAANFAAASGLTLDYARFRIRRAIDAFYPEGRGDA